MAKIIALTAQKTIAGTYACIHPENISYTEFAKAAFSAFGQNPEINFLWKMDDISDNVFEDNFELYSIIDYSPQISLSQGIQEIANKRVSMK